MEKDLDKDARLDDLEEERVDPQDGIIFIL